jgi:ADP-heptose:LPS heptosyltransferase
MLSVRAPDHFGDGVMAIPAIEALGRVHGARVHAPPWGPELYRGLAGVEVAPRHVAPVVGSTGVLLKPSFGAAWRWRRLPRRVGLPTFGRRWLLTDVVEPVPGEHRRDGWARVAAALGATTAARPRFAGAMERAVPRVTAGRVAIHGWGRTPRTRWPGMRACADALVMQGVDVAFLAGPGEGEPVRALAGPHPVVDHAALDVLAEWLARVAVVLSHDSGLAHFADACGVPVVMVHGPTDPRETGVGVAVVGRPWPALDAVVDAVRGHL